MSNAALNISVTGIQAAQKMASAIGQNIANANTQGYRRVDVITSEMNFSGPNNIPFLPAGVMATAVTPDKPWLDSRLNMAVNQNTQAQSYLNSLQDFSSSINLEAIEKRFSEFMGVSQDAMLIPTSQTLERFRASLDGLIIDINQFTNLVENSIKRLNQQRELIQKELQSETNILNINDLQGKLTGINKALNTINNTSDNVNNIIANAVNDINDAYGIEIIKNDNGKYISDFNPNGDFQSLTEYGSQQFNTDIGTEKSMLGIAIRDAISSKEFANTELQGASEAWDNAYGVDITSEFLKLKQVESYHQANVMAAKVASDMTGTLLNILV